MVVSELIEALKKYNQSLRIVIDGYEGGLVDLTPSQVIEIKVALDMNSSDIYCGPHEVVDEWLLENDNQKEDAIYLTRSHRENR